MNNENVYSAPQSDVTAVVDQTNEIEIFPRMSAWKVFFLAIPTVGFYSAYWLYSRSKLMNTLPNRSMSMTPVIIMLVLAGLSVPFSILSNVYKEVAIIGIISGVLSLVHLVFYLMTAFPLRRQLRSTLESSGASDSNLNGVMILFFSAIYMQFKINKCIDERNNVDVADREKIF